MHYAFVSRRFFLIWKIEFSFRSVERRHQELLAILGNLVLRLSGKRVNPKQVVPSGPTRDYNPEERALIQKLNDLSGNEQIECWLSFSRFALDLYIEKSSNFDFSSILESIVLVLHDVNKAFGKAIPWKLSPDEQRHILHVCYESLRISALLLSPVIPQVSDTILTTLGVPENMRKHRDAIFGSLERSSDFSISKPKALFSKL